MVKKIIELVGVVDNVTPIMKNGISDDTLSPYHRLCLPRIGYRSLMMAGSGLQLHGRIPTV